MPSYPLRDIGSPFDVPLLEQQHPYPKNWIMEFHYEQGANSPIHKWSCLACGTTYTASDRDMCSLTVASHALECAGDAATAAARHDLLNAIVATDSATFLRPKREDFFGAGLIQRGGMWILIADAIGWPKGYHAEDGWFTSYEEARQSMNLPEPFSLQFLESTKRDMIHE